MNEVLPPIPAKRYFTIGEVAELCGVKPHVLRYWEQEFTQLRPMKRRGNRRYYQNHEVLLIRKIRELLYDEGFTIQGARMRLSGRQTMANLQAEAAALARQQLAEAPGGLLAAEPDPSQATWLDPTAASQDALSIASVATASGERVLPERTTALQEPITQDAASPTEGGKRRAASKVLSDPDLRRLHKELGEALRLLSIAS